MAKVKLTHKKVPSFKYTFGGRDIGITEKEIIIDSSVVENFRFDINMYDIEVIDGVKITSMDDDIVKIRVFDDE